MRSQAQPWHVKALVLQSCRLSHGSWHLHDKSTCHGICIPEKNETTSPPIDAQFKGALNWLVARCR